MKQTETTWRRVTKANPCPICRKPDWCCIGAQFINCMRVQSPKAAKNGGWLHPIEGAKPVPLPPKEAPAPSINSKALMDAWLADCPDARLPELASDLHVSLDSLLALRCAWAGPHKAWAFPMMDPYGEFVGIRLRNLIGKKWAVRGSHQGLFIPRVTPQATLYVCEGPTDTAAALTLGLFAVGRPSCVGCEGMLYTFILRHKVRRAVVLSDNDEPGYIGAMSLCRQLPCPSVTLVPPAKDIREFVMLGGSVEMLVAIESGMVWNTPSVQ